MGARGKLSTNNEVKQSGKPNCPKTLSKGAKAIWNVIVKDLESRGLLDETDGHILEQFAILKDQQQVCLDFIAENGLTFETASGMRRPHPEVKMASECGKAIKGLLEAMGLTPAARARLQGVDTSEAIDPKWLNPPGMGE